MQLKYSVWVGGSEVNDHYLAETRTADLRGAVHQACEVIGYFLGRNGLFHRVNDEVGCLNPTHVTQHHFCRQNL